MGRSLEEMLEDVGLLVFIYIIMILMLSKILMLSNLDRPSANMTASANRPVADEDRSEPQAIVETTPTRSPLGLLDLPSEIRVMIFRHLLVSPHGLDIGYRSSQPVPPLDILRTSRLIHREAFGVFYGENQFINFAGRLSHYVPPLANTIQNIHVRVMLLLISFPVSDFMRMMQWMANPLVTHNTLTVDFLLRYAPSRWSIPLRWYVRALGRFTNFRTIELYVSGGFRTSSMNRNEPISEVFEYLKLALEPVLGDVEDISIEGHSRLRFHPLDYRNRLIQEVNDGNLADSLEGGFRLEWDEDSTHTVL